MEQIAHSPSPDQLMLTLALEPADARDPDPALIEALGRDLVEVLRREQHIVQPVYTGQRGGNVIVDLWLALAPFLTSVWTQKEVILADGSALVTILAAAVGLKRSLQQAYEKRVGKAAAPTSPIRLALTIEGLPVQVEVPDVQSAQELIAFAHRLQADHPEARAQVTPQSKVKAQAHVAKRPASRRR